MPGPPRSLAGHATSPAGLGLAGRRGGAREGRQSRLCSTGAEASSLISVETGDKEILSCLPAVEVLLPPEHLAEASSPRHHLISSSSISWLPVSGCAMW